MIGYTDPKVGRVPHPDPREAGQERAGGQQAHRRECHPGVQGMGGGNGTCQEHPDESHDAVHERQWCPDLQYDGRLHDRCQSPQRHYHGEYG